MNGKFAFCILFLSCFGFTAQAATVYHELDVSVGAFAAASGVFSYSIDNDSYKAESKLKTSGFFGKIYPFSEEAFSSGKISKGKLKTLKHNQVLKSRFNTRKKEFVFDKDGNMLFRINTRNDVVKKVPIEQPKEKFAADMQTLLVNLADNVKKNGSCKFEQNVFNGKKMFKNIFDDLGSENIDLGYFKGTALKCSMFIESDEKSDNNIMFQATANQPIVFWLSNDKSQPLPCLLKIEITDSPFGKVVVNTKNIKIEE